MYIVKVVVVVLIPIPYEVELTVHLCSLYVSILELKVLCIK